MVSLRSVLFIIDLPEANLKYSIFNLQFSIDLKQLDVPINDSTYPSIT
jgi:hypothetical protein